jgi:hypothetical protein
VGSEVSRERQVTERQTGEYVSSLVQYGPDQNSLGADNICIDEAKQFDERSMVFLEQIGLVNRIFLLMNPMTT